MTPVGSACRRAQISLGLCWALATCLRAPAMDLVLTRSGEFSVNSWTIEQGLPGNAVVALAQGGDGYLWLATLNGPARFDGARIVRVALWDGLPSLLTQRLLADHQGRLWIGTQDAGLTVLEGGTFRSYGRADGLPGLNVRGLAEDAQGGVWVATDEGLVRWDGKFTNVAPPRQRLVRPGFTSVCCGAQKTFVVSEDWRVWEEKDNSWSMLPPLGKRGFRFDRVFISRAGVVWSQLYPTGLARLEETAPPSAGEKQIPGTNQAARQMWRVVGTESGLPNSYISCALERTNGDFFFGSFERGLYQFRNDHAIPVALNEPPDMDGVLALHADAEGNLWAGTRTRGLLRLRPPRVHTLAGTEVVRVARLAFEKNGRLWMGGGEGLWSGREGEISAVPLPKGLPRWNVGALLPAAGGGVWIGLFNGGLWRFNPDTDEQPLPQLRDPDLNASVVALATDHADGIWFGTDHGKIVHVGGAGQKWFSPQETAQKRITVLEADPAGGVWAGTEGAGVLRLDENGKVQLHFSREEGLPGKGARSLLRDRGGVVWIGTVGGLCRWDGSRLQVYDSRSGLPDEHFASLAEDDAGRLWCGANNALFRLDKAELEAIALGRARVVHPLIVAQSDGLRPVPFSTGIPSEGIRGPAGQFYFPRAWDVLVLSPRDFERPPSAPRSRIEQVAVDGQPLGVPTDENEPVRIRPRRSQIDIRYTAFQWTAPETLRFRYRLADIDENWTEAGDQRVATFRRLPPGSYRFEVSAAVGGGEWAEPPARLAFVIEPLFWQTAWFRGLMIVGGAASIGSLVWRRVRTLEKRRAAQELFSRRLLESQETERRRIAAELHDGLGQNLVLVKNLVALEQSGGANEKPRTAEIAAAADRALEEVHSISYALRPPELDRVGLAKAIAGMVRRAGEASGIQFATQFDLDGGLAPGADIQLFRIAQEAVNNLVKHSGAKNARVELWCDEGGVHLVVADDGRGLPPAQDKSKSERGSGLGLSGIEERARLVGAQCKWLSQPGKGTTISLLIPTAARDN